MKITIIQGWAFVGDKYLTCIGMEDEVVNATPERLLALILEAYATAKYNSIQSACGYRVH